MPSQLLDNRQLGRMIPACSSAWELPDGLQDSCLLICLIIASWPEGFMPSQLLDNRPLRAGFMAAHLLDNGQLGRRIHACSAA